MSEVTRAVNGSGQDFEVGQTAGPQNSVLRMTVVFYCWVIGRH